MVGGIKRRRRAFDRDYLTQVEGMTMSDSEPPKLDTSQSEERWRRFAKLAKPFQFSLRTLLIVVVLVSIALIWPAIKIHQTYRENERKEREAAIQAEWRGYGAIDVNVDEEGNVLYAAARQNAKGADNLLGHLEGQTKLRILDLRSGDVSNTGLKHRGTDQPPGNRTPIQ